MTILRKEPPGPAESLEEVFAIAHAMEHEAATRYAELALRMREEGNASLADVFARLAAEESSHVESIVQWSERESGRVPDPAQVRWDLSNTFDDEGAGTTAPALLTAYRALSMAVRNEERAFAFWSYVAAHAPSAVIRQAAEAMAHEELGHVATLRRERRRAYHAQCSPPRGAERCDVVADSERLERRLAQRLEQMAEMAEPSEAARLRDAARDARDTAGQLAIEPLPVTDAASPAKEDPNDPVALSEALVDLYLDAAERVQEEAALVRAQTLAGRAISRLAWLRADLSAMHRR